MKALRIVSLATFLLTLIVVLASSENVELSANEWAQKAYKAYQEEKYEDAVKFYDKAIDIDKEYTKAFNNRGLAKLKLKDYEGAEDDFITVLVLDPSNVTVRINLGNLEIRRNDPEQAIFYLSKAIEINPNLPKVFNNRGLAYQDKGEPEKAIDDFEKALSLDPEHASAYDNYALFLASYPDEQYRNGQKALMYAKKASELTDWKDGGKIDTLAVAYAEIGNFGKAIEYAEQALRLEKDKDNIKEIKEHLELFQQGKPYRAEVQNKKSK